MEKRISLLILLIVILVTRAVANAEDGALPASENVTSESRINSKIDAEIEVVQQDIDDDVLNINASSTIEQGPNNETKRPLIVDLESPDELKRLVLEKQDPSASSLQPLSPSSGTSSVSQTATAIPGAVTPATPPVPPVQSSSERAISNVTMPGFNYAAMDAGAMIMASNAEAQGVTNLLISDPDKYSLSPCTAQQWFVISLSEEILVYTVEVANFEKYSSSARKFHLFGSHKFPSEEWFLVGEFERPNHRGTDTFRILQPMWARYIKVQILSNHGNEAYCTLSKIRIFGQTTLETLREDLALSQQQIEAVKTTISDHQISSAASSEIAATFVADEVTNIVVNVVGQPVEIEGECGLESSQVSSSEQPIQTSAQAETLPDSTSVASFGTPDSSAPVVDAFALSLVGGKPAHANMDNIFKTLMEKVKGVEIDVSVLKACLETNNEKLKNALELLDKNVKFVKDELVLMKRVEEQNRMEADRLTVFEQEFESVIRRQKTLEFVLFGMFFIIFWLMMR